MKIETNPNKFITKMISVKNSTNSESFNGFGAWSLHGYGEISWIHPIYKIVLTLVSSKIKGGGKTN